MPLQLASLINLPLSHLGFFEQRYSDVALYSPLELFIKGRTEKGAAQSARSSPGRHLRHNVLAVMAAF